MWTNLDTLALLLTAPLSLEFACLVLCRLGPILERHMSMERLDRVLRICVCSGLVLTPVLTAFCRWLNRGAGTVPEWLMWVIPAIWLAGVVYLGVFRYLGMALVLRRAERSSGRCADREIADMKEGMAAWLDVRGGVALYTGGLIPTPYTRGLLRKRIYLSDASCTREEWKLLLTHELIHCRRNDCLYRGLLLVLRASFWFCPQVGRFADYAAEVNEMSCDERVIRERPRGARGPYCRLLVRLRRDPSPLPVTGLAGDGDSLERRLRRLIRAHGDERPLLSAALAAGTALVVPAVTVLVSGMINQWI